jgi:hypothetical protein
MPTDLEVSAFMAVLMAAGRDAGRERLVNQRPHNLHLISTQLTKF